MELVWIAILSVFVTAIVLIENLKLKSRIKELEEIQELEEMLGKRRQEENPEGGEWQRWKRFLVRRKGHLLGGWRLVFQFCFLSSQSKKLGKQKEPES